MFVRTLGYAQLLGLEDTDEKWMTRLNGEMLETPFVVERFESSNSFRLREHWGRNGKNKAIFMGELTVHQEERR